MQLEYERSHLTIYYNRRVMFVVRFLYFGFINIVMIVL